MLVRWSVPKQQDVISAAVPSPEVSCPGKAAPTITRGLSIGRGSNLFHWILTNTCCRQFNETAALPIFPRSPGSYWSGQLSEIAHPHSPQHQLCLSTQWKSNSAHKVSSSHTSRDKMKKKPLTVCLWLFVCHESKKCCKKKSPFLTFGSNKFKYCVFREWSHQRVVYNSANSIEDASFCFKHDSK